jgi:hypothetical protein
MVVIIDKVSKNQGNKQKQTNKKYQIGIRAHKEINLHDNDSSSEDDDANSAYKRNRKLFNQVNLTIILVIYSKYLSLNILI